MQRSMATNESEFKTEFRKALLQTYGALAEIWTSNDMFRAGLPDFNATWKGRYFSIEAKFVKKPPAKDVSLVLKHELSALQYQHLKRMHETGSVGVVLVGFPDIAVAIPIQSIIPENPGAGIVTNIQLHYLKKLNESGFGFVKLRGKWQVDGFFEKLVEIESP